MLPEPAATPLSRARPVPAPRVHPAAAPGARRDAVPFPVVISPLPPSPAARSSLCSGEVVAGTGATLPS
ncbi:unnamed protein product [Urochloa humidicola]